MSNVSLLKDSKKEYRVGNQGEYVMYYKNKNISREDKILARREYEQNQAIN